MACLRNLAISLLRLGDATNIAQACHIIHGATQTRSTTPKQLRQDLLRPWVPT